MEIRIEDLTILKIELVLFVGEFNWPSQKL